MADDLPFDPPAESAGPPLVFDSPEEEAAHRQGVRDAIASVEAGRSIPYEEVRRRLLAWGGSNE